MFTSCNNALQSKELTVVFSKPRVAKYTLKYTKAPFMYFITKNQHLTYIALQPSIHRFTFAK